MIDSQVLVNNIQGQLSVAIEQTVKDYVEEFVHGETWETKVQDLVDQDLTRRITKKLSLTDVNDLITTNVESLMQSQGLADIIQQHTAAMIEQHVGQYVDRVVQELNQDSAWFEKITTMINQDLTRRIIQKLHVVDVDTVVRQSIDPAVDRWFQNHPDSRVGVADISTETQITITDHGVDIASSLVAPNLSVSHDAEIKNDLVVKNLCVKGVINTDGSAWQEIKNVIQSNVLSSIDQTWQDDLVKKVLDISKQGIDFENVTVGGQKIIDNRCLSSEILGSSLNSVGVLKSLQVEGTSDLGATVHIRKQRVGINTDSPESALSVWDEEVSIIAGKLKEQTAYIGTSRLQDLTIGINRQGQIQIRTDGTVHISKLTVGRHRIVHEPELPGYSGTKGDIVFNSNPKNDGIWGWQCLGAFKWVPLKSAE